MLTDRERAGIIDIMKTAVKRVETAVKMGDEVQAGTLLDMGRRQAKAQGQRWLESAGIVLKKDRKEKRKSL